MLLCLAQLLLYGIGQTLDVANDAEAYIILHEYLVFQRTEYQSHQGGYFVGRTSPVLSGERVERQVFDTQTGTLCRYLAHSLYTGLMAEAALFASFVGPAPVAVHDDGDVLGDVVSLYHCDMFYISPISHRSLTAVAG